MKTDTGWKTAAVVLNVLLVAPHVAGDTFLTMKYAAWFAPALAFGFWRTLGLVALIRWVLNPLAKHEKREPEEELGRNLAMLFIGFPLFFAMGWCIHSAMVAP